MPGPVSDKFAKPNGYFLIRHTQGELECQVVSSNL
jgi:hypothetical protein